MIRPGIWFAGLLCAVAMAHGADDESAAAERLQIARDRQSVQAAQAAAEFLEQGETARALPLLERLWIDAPHALIGTGPVRETARAHVIRLLSQRPAGEQHQFWDRIEAAAGENSDDVLRGAPSRAGLNVLWRTAARLRDHGEFALACAALDQAARHPKALPREALLADVQRLDLLDRLYGPEAMTDWRSTADENLLRTSIRQGDVTVTVGEWIAQRTSASPQNPAVFPHDRPALTPIWRHAVESPAHLITGLERAGRELRAEGVIRLPAIPPLIVESRAVIRTPTGLDCRDVITGELRWSLKDRYSAEGVWLAAQHQHPFYREKLLTSVMQRMEANTLSGAMSHDESTLYRVIEAEPAGKPQDALTVYLLEAVELATGRPIWRIGGGQSSSDELRRTVEWSPPPGPVHEPRTAVSVSGPPLVLGDFLYLMAKRESALWLYKIHRTRLEVDWSFCLREFPLEVDQNRPTRFTGCMPMWTGTLLICPTGAGQIVAVDPIGPAISWIASYPGDLLPRIPGDTHYLDFSAVRTSLNGWRGTAIHHSRGRLIISTPDSQHVQVLNARTGQTICTIPRGNGVTLLGIAGERLLILEPAAVRAHAISTGELQWRTVIGEICGQGVVDGNQAIQPLASGAIAVLDITTGRRLPGDLHSPISWGRLVRASDGWISADEFQIAKFPDLAAVRKSPVPETMTIIQAQRDYEAGDFAAARLQLTDSRGETARRLRLDADLADLRFFPDRREELREALRNSAATREESAEVLAALAEAALRQADEVRAVTLCLEGLSLGVNGDRRTGEESPRVVRWDRMFCGLIAAALRTTDDARRPQMEEILTSHWQAARNAGDPFALQLHYQRTRGLAWTRRTFPADIAPVFLGSRLLSRELSLREAAEAGHLMAWGVLSREWLAAGFPRDAEDIAFHLLRSGPGRLADDEVTWRRHLAENGEQLNRLQQRMTQGAPEIWPLRAPRVTETRGAHTYTRETPIPIVAAPFGLWDRLDVTIDLEGRRLQFTGGGQPGAWALMLPKSLLPSSWSYCGWGIDRLLILRVGSRLLGVTPFDEQGSAQASVLWSLDLWDTASLESLGFLGDNKPPRWKRASENEFRLKDFFGRDFSPVGPVRAGYLCLQRQGKLIAIETQTGRQLWERWDLAPGSLALGDDDHVVLWHPERQTMEVLAAVDGRTICHHACGFAFTDVWHEAGPRVWIGQGDAELTLSCRDLVQDRTLWRKTFPQGSLPIPLDLSTAAVIDPRGLLHWLDLETGDPLDEPLTVELPPVIERVLLSRDEARWYLGLSGPPPRSLDWQRAQPLNGFRRPQLNGPLYALDRSLRQIAWKRHFHGEPWLLEQNQTSPVLIQIYKMPLPPVQAATEGVLLLIDKRTGQDVFTHRDLSLQPYFALEPNADWQRFDIRTQHTEFHFDYRSESPE